MDFTEKLEGLLKTDFQLSSRTEKDPLLSDFFSLIEALDKRLSFVPVRRAQFLSPARGEDSVAWYDQSKEVYNFLERPANKTLAEFSLISFMEIPEGLRFIETLHTEKDFIVKTDDNVIFMKDDVIGDIARLCKLSGDALARPCATRDAYIAHLFHNKCAEDAVKDKNAFTLCVFNDGTINRCFAVRSGKYLSIPQTTLKEVYADIMSTAPFSTGQKVYEYTIDHQRSAVYLDLPDAEEVLKDLYPELERYSLIPGILLETGSTGYCTLKAAMTYRRPGGKPTIFGEVAQKHCATYEKDRFLKDSKEEIWGRLKGFPEQLSKLSKEEIERKEIVSYLEDLFKRISLRSVFMQKDAPKREKTDYQKNIISQVMELLSVSSKVNKCELAITLMDVALTTKVPESYREPLMDKLMKAAYYM